MGWSNGIAEWVDGDTVFISISFSWKLQDAFQRAVWYRESGYKVRVGGPGLFQREESLLSVAEVGGTIDALPHHNNDATIASRGCPMGCYFCIVPQMEGRKFTLLPDFTPRPILCDNNLSALPVAYQKYIIEKYQKYDVPLLDANSGFEPRTFTEETYHRWKVINRGAWRFGYDETKEEDAVYRMVQVLKDEPAGKKRVYVLIGNEPFDECYRRVMQVIEWKCEPFVQPMIPLGALQKKPVVKFDWTRKKLTDLARWSNRWVWRTVPFAEYRPSGAY